MLPQADTSRLHLAPGGGIPEKPQGSDMAPAAATFARLAAAAAAGPAAVTDSELREALTAAGGFAGIAAAAAAG